jgi:hypothetical protein
MRPIHSETFRSIIVLLLVIALSARAQDALSLSPPTTRPSPSPTQSLFKDSHDGAFDVSNFLGTGWVRP